MADIESLAERYNDSARNSYSRSRSGSDNKSSHYYSDCIESLTERCVHSIVIVRELYILITIYKYADIASLAERCVHTIGIVIIIRTSNYI
jgi:hypothetical protein